MLMKRIKTAYEIAMENAEKITEEDDGTATKMAKKQEVKPILAKFFKEEIDAEGLWGELKEKDDGDYVIQAQELILESLGLRSSEDEINKRKEGIMALESLKDQQNSNVIEQLLNKIEELKNQHQEQRDSLEERFKQQIEQQSQAQMKPVQTEDGRTAMKLENSVNRETKKQMDQQLSQLEERSEQVFTGLIEEIKNNL